ncbi:hypothetical protein LWI28_014833 [Acer negundo]|uniref:Uncharacterized protein n=1 Tax=Acer negundo TaxID=4023 RepID=A0AAD5I716_ACENE|nr:hypothetical protein LWI28_014833 [Acer negundo]
MDVTRISTENSIHKHIEQKNYLRLSSRLIAVVVRLDTQAKMTTTYSKLLICVCEIFEFVKGSLGLQNYKRPLWGYCSISNSLKTQILGPRRQVNH